MLAGIRKVCYLIRIYASTKARRVVGILLSVKRHGLITKVELCREIKQLHCMTGYMSFTGTVGELRTLLDLITSARKKSTQVERDKKQNETNIKRQIKNWAWRIADKRWPSLSNWLEEQADKKIIRMLEAK